MNDEERFSAAVWWTIALGAVLTGFAIAFVAGFLVGHFTGHTKTTTVAASEVSGGETSEEAEAEAEAQAEAEAEAQAEAEAEAQAEAEKEAEEAEAEKEAEGAASTAEVEEGKQVFTASGCGSCHTLAAAGASGTIGPDLDEALPEKDAAFIRESIVEPDAQVPSGYSPGIMPSTFKTSLSSSELEALVAFLAQEAGK